MDTLTAMVILGALLASWVVLVLTCYGVVLLAARWLR